jgi:hypothetical protein
MIGTAVKRLAAPPRRPREFHHGLLHARPHWHDELAMLPYMNAPRASAQAVFWKKPFTVVFYSLAALGGPILIALATLAVVGLPQF